MKTLIIVCKKNRDYNGIIITTLGLSHISSDHGYCQAVDTCIL
jgi:hypothetical protein